MKLYKVIKDGKAKDGGVFDYSSYLPKRNSAGKWTPKISDLKLCNRGYHVTPFWNMFWESGAQVFEVECKGLIEEEGVVGVVDKFVCSSLRLVREFKPVFDGKHNTGYWNTGNRNTGNRNTGDSNTGSWNTGSWNTGDSNTGSWNTGDSNTGNRNTGNWNGKGGNYQSGSFNTKEPETVELFNKPIKFSDYKNISFPSWLYHSGNWLQALKDASVHEVKDTVSLPNFDYSVFEKITGITKRMIEEKLKGVVV